MQIASCTHTQHAMCAGPEERGGAGKLKEAGDQGSYWAGFEEDWKDDS